MDNHRRSSIIESAGGYGQDTRSQLNTTTLPKPQQRAPDFNPRQPRPEFYQQQQQQQQQGPYGAATSNRPSGQQQQQRPPPPPQQQQHQQPRTPGDRVSPWNIIRQALPPDAVPRGPVPPQQQQRQPQPYYNNNNMQQRPPPPQEQQQQYRQQAPPPTMQDRRPTLSRVEDRPPFRPENGRPVRPVSGGGGNEDEGLVVNSSVTQQPPLNRRDSTLYAGSRAGPAESGAVTDSANKQWQRPAAPPYGKPPEQQYGRQTAAIPEGHEQPRYPQPAGNYNRPVAVAQLQQQDDDNGRRPTTMLQPPPNGPKVRDVVQPLTRRDSVLDNASLKMAEATLRKNDVPAATAEYGRRPPSGSLIDTSENGGRRPSDQMTGGHKRPPAPVDSQEDIGGRRTTEYKKTEQEEAVVRRASDYNNRNKPESADYGVAGRPAMIRPEIDKEDRTSTRDYQQQQQQQRKVSSDNEPKSTVEHGNRASELRKAHFEATHMKQVKQQPYWKADGNSRMDENKTFVREEPQRSAESRSYAPAVISSGEYDPNNKTITSSVNSFDNFRNDSLSFHKNSRPDTLEIIKDNEPLKDSSNSNGNYRSDNDVGKSPSKIPKKDRSELKTPTRATTPAKTPDSVMSTGQKKLPMNKIQVGSAPSPNLKVVRSKIGSLQNTSHKPGGGQVKIENRKLEWKAGTRIMAKNDTYVPGGGDKKIQSVKLQWNAKPKVGSLENKTHKPGGGDKKIESIKLDFKDKAKPKIGSKDNIKHTPGGGAIKSQSSQLLEMESSSDIEDQKLEIKAQSKVGSLDNMKHKPGGGEVKIFDDKSYTKQTMGQIGTPTKSQLQRSSSMKSPTSMKLYSPDERPKSHVKIVVTPTSEEDLYVNIGVDTGKGGYRRSANSRSPSLQNNIVIPEEAVIRRNQNY